MLRLLIAVKRYSFILLACIAFNSFSQNQPDSIYQNNIRSVRFHSYNNQLTIPILNLNSGDRLELHFDDMDADVKSYYYTYQLCDYDWNEVDISPFDYIKGFTQMRISTYRYSSLSYTKYTHYQAVLPEANSGPSRSGNYILKVFLDGDVSKLVFTRRLLVVDPKASIAAQVVIPFSPKYYQTHQRIKFNVNVAALNSFSAGQQVKAVVLQNYRWDNAQGNVLPTFVRGSMLEYNSEDNFVFPAGKEWRWLDLRSVRLQSERMDSLHITKTTYDAYLKPDLDRSAQRYYYYYDLNGLYSIETYESINPYWQADYATVHFRFVPPGNVPYDDKDVYLYGQLNDYKLNDATKMKFNEVTKEYEINEFLKQGYYSYGYLLVNKKDPSQTSMPDGNYMETENVYTVLIYYRSFSDQADQLIGIATIDSRTDKPNTSF
ncbi:type IX secretion system plug protein [Ferruginibacter albus]|uniref:type IX secretion system plug protein n=1 Tax=Ferruginibacter albus TaxID=2875540 RepID=UPI001CC7A80A|nr:DUF5103 domain-containing protein [Ferruginibacter albus]UAY53291.1 DUF5103 domain-containing protein [Ferruginibacter albus]